jgi:hypothetical protein
LYLGFGCGTDCNSSSFNVDFGYVVVKPEV